MFWENVTERWKSYCEGIPYLRQEIQSAILDATQRMSYQGRTITVAEPTKPAVQIANEVMEAAIEEYEGMLKCIIWTF